LARSEREEIVTFKKRNVVLPLAMVIAGGLVVTAAALARARSSAEERGAVCGGQGMGRGSGHEMGPGGGHGMGPGGGADMMGIHFLFAHRDDIRRSVANVARGVRTTTESDDPNVAAQLREHVRAMYARVKEHRPINAGDPLFAALFKNADKIDVRIQDTPKGLIVTETSSDAEVASLIRRHAEVVNLFLANGMHEMMQSH
jgi:hypothetical protein